MKNSLLLFFQTFRKATSSILIGVFLATMIMPWYNVWAVTGVFDTLQTVANVSPVTEVKATRTLSIGAVPADTETIVIGLCTVTFSAIAGATTDELACDDNVASVDLDTDGGDTPRTAEDIASIIRSITNLSDTGHGALTLSGSTTDVILTTSSTEAAASEITFTDGTSWDITSSASTTGTIPVSAVAQVVTFTPSAPTAGETFRANINGTNYDYTVVGSKTVAQVVTAMATLMDAHANAVCTDNTTHITCTATPAGTAFTSYSASVVDITAPILSQTTAVTTPTSDNTPAYTFTTNEAGTITYGGSCSSGTTSATVGANTISFNTLADATYSNCTITVTDTANNASSALAVTAFTVDTGAPSVSISLSDSALKIGDTSTVTYTFTEVPTGFTTADITTPNGTIDAVNSTGNPLVFTSTLTPTWSIEDSSNIVTVGTGWTDAAGNAPLSSSNSSNYTVDTVRPTVTIGMDDTALKVGDTSVVTFTFSESVTGFANADVTTIENGTLGTITGSGTTYTATFTPNASVEDNTNVITVDKSGVADTAGNAGSGTTNTSNYTIDTTRPTVAISLSDSALKVGETSTITFTFSEAPTGFTAADVTVENGTIGSTSSSSATVYTALFTPTASLDLDATNIVTVGTGWTDAAGNAPSGSSTSSNYQVDTLAPTVNIVMSDTDLKLGDTSLVTFTFSESVTGFANADVTTIANGTLATIAGSGSTYTATFTPNASVEDNTNVITVDKSGVADTAGNAGSGTTSTSNYTIDTLATVISAVSSTALYPPGAAITWTTSEAATSQVEYGTTISYGSTTTVDATLVTNHTVNISGLPAWVIYHYRVISVDAAGNTTIGADNGFPASTGGGGGGGSGIGVVEPVVISAVSADVKTKNNTQTPTPTINSAPEEITPVSFKNIQKHINNSEVPVLRSADENEFATREQTVTLAVTIRGVELAEYYACEGRHSDTQGDNISESTCQIAEKAQDAGIISRSKTTFRPLDSVTRVEAYSMLMKSACITIDKNNTDWRANVIEKAIELGFTKRTFETFSPDRSILISEIIAIGKRLENWKEQNGSCTE